MNVTLKLWVSNQEGVDCDCTARYIEVAGWQAPTGVALDVDAQTINGEAEAAWAAYHELATLVAMAGHGTDCDGNEIDGEPVLTACPTQLVCEGYTCAAESLARLESPRQETWAGFVEAIPSLAQELTAHA